MWYDDTNFGPQLSLINRLWTICSKPPPISAEIEDLLLFWGVFCDFFKSYGSKPLTLIMFFVVLWEVVSPLRAIFDIMTHNRENRKKRLPKWPYLGPLEAFLKVKYSKNQGDDFEWFFKVVLMVLELYPGYGKVSWGFKESIPSLRTSFQALLEKIYDSVFARRYVEKQFFACVFKCVFADRGFKETMP